MTQIPANLSGEARPWDGHENPLEGLYLHFMAEIAALEDRLGKKDAPPVPFTSSPVPSYAGPVAASGTVEPVVGESV